MVIDCQIDSDDKVWPMVAPGAPINEAFDEQDLEAKNAEYFYVKERSKGKWRNKNEQSV